MAVSSYTKRMQHHNRQLKRWSVLWFCSGVMLVGLALLDLSVHLGVVLKLTLLWFAVLCNISGAINYMLHMVYLRKDVEEEGRRLQRQMRDLEWGVDAAVNGGASELVEEDGRMVVKVKQDGDNI